MSSSSQTTDTPSRHTRNQLRLFTGMEHRQHTLHADSGIGLSPPPKRRKSAREQSLRINPTPIMHSPEMMSSPTELSPNESLDSPLYGNPREQNDAHEHHRSVPHQSTATVSIEDAIRQYRPPKRQVPANPRRPRTPVPGVAPKAALGNRLRLVADRVNHHNFKYNPVCADEVRLMKLVQGEPNSRIEVELMTVPFRKLGTHYRFEALSYHWGEDDAAKPIFIRDISRPPPKIDSLYQSVNRAQAPENEIRIKYNLFEALYHLRSQEQDLWLWVDALCIDQDNPKEKEVQVARIADVYVAAENVLIWLGAGNERTTQAIQLLHDLAHVEQPSDIIANEKRLPDWKDLAHFMKASWFSRLWVIQELVLAKNAVVYCGSKTIHWNDLRHGVYLFVLCEDNIRPNFHKSKDYNHDYHALEDLDLLAAKLLVEKVSDVFRKNARDGTFVASQCLEHLMSSLFPFHTSDPRDTINGLLNISKEGIALRARGSARVEATSPPARRATTGPDKVRRETNNHIAPVYYPGEKLPPLPSYSKDLLDVYVDTIKWIVDSTGSINILCRHWARPEHTRQVSGYPELVRLPTWIKLTSDGPLKHTEDAWYRQNADSLVGLPDKSPYNACNRFNKAKIEFYTHEASELAKSEPVPSALRKSASAKVKGIRLGDIVRCTDPVSGGNITMNALDMLGWKRGQSSSQVFEDLKDDVWQPLVAERGFNGENPLPLWQRSCMEILANHTDNGSINIDMILPKIKLQYTKDFLKRMRQVTWNRRFFELRLDTVFMSASYSTGYPIGLGPSDADPGDIVCILYGCSVPCILRPRINHDDVGGLAYDFIGETYIYGFMDGEAITTLEAKELRDKSMVFKLL